MGQGVGVYRGYWMTNNIITVSGSDLFSGLYDCLLTYFLPVLAIWGAWYAIKICVRVFKHVAGR